MNTPGDKPLRYFDTRTIERNMARGLVSKEEYEAWLQSLPDEAEEGTKLETQFVHSNSSDEEAAEAE